MRLSKEGGGGDVEFFGEWITEWEGARDFSLVDGIRKGMMVE